MVVLGLLLILLGALAIVLAVVTADGPAEYIGIDVGDLGVFLVGVAAGVAIWWGYSLSKIGTRRTIAQRREHKRLTELSERLDRAESDRGRDADDRGAEGRHRGDETETR